MREHLAPERDGVSMPVQALARDLRELDAHRVARVGIRRELRLGALDVEELLPRALLGVDVLELTERLTVPGIALDHQLERARRLVVVREAVDPELRHAHVERDLLGRIRRRLRLAREHLDEVVPAPHLLVRRRERVERFGVVRRELDDRVPAVDHHHVEAEVIAVDRHHLA